MTNIYKQIWLFPLTHSITRGRHVQPNAKIIPIKVILLRKIGGEVDTKYCISDLSSERGIRNLSGGTN